MNESSAKDIINATEETFSKLSRLLEVVNSSCDADTRKSFQHAIGVALTELDMEILETLYKEFPELTPPDR